MRILYTKSLLTVLLLLCSAVASAQSFESNGISYSILSLSNRTVEVAHNANYQGFIIIPSTTDYSGISFKVTGIGDVAFSGTKVTEMIISEGVTYIGDSAFYPSTLKEIIIPNSVISIGSCAFEDCTGLTSITIPNSVTSIGESAFLDCTGLTSITIPNSVTTIGDYTFYGCTGLTSVTIPDSVTTIGDYAFYNCTGLTSITIPNSIITIGDYAFERCTGLTSITIPNSVTTIGDRAFYNCTGLICVTIGNSVTSIGSGAFYGCTKLKLVCDCSPLFISAGSQDFGNVAYYANIVTTGEISHTILTDNYIFSTIDGVPTLVAYIGSDSQISLPLEYNGTNYVIGQSAFGNCTCLTSITIPNSVTSIGRSAFIACSGLTSITIGNSVTSIGDYAFRDCTNLTSITIPNSVTTIGIYTFYNCTGLTRITIPNSVTSIGNGAFDYCTGLTSVTIPNSVTSIGNGAFYGCTGLTSIKVGSGNTKYDSRDNCNAIIETATNTLIRGCKNTIIPNSVSSIRASAFYNCTGLTSITIPNSVTSIGGNAFRNCTGLTSVTIGNSVTSIGEEAFKKCTGLTSVTIGSSVTSIGQEAFKNCTRLTEVHINDLSAWCKITFLNNENNPLYYAKKLYLNGQLLTNLVIPSDITEIKDYAFYYCTGLTSITIPNSVTSIGSSAFSACTGLTSVTIGNSVTWIGSSAFSGCRNLTSITIPNSVTSIGDAAFYNCTGLTSITIPSSVTSIGSSAFDGCAGLTEVHINDLSAWCKISFKHDVSNPLFFAKNLYLNEEKITNLVIPSDITEIKDYAFFYCTGLTSITIPNSVTTIGKDAFYGCTGLTSITIPNSVTTIGDYAFSGCTGLTRITIPNSVTSIGSGAFSACTGLIEMYVKANTPPSADYYTFYNVPKTIPVYVPAGTKAAYQAADYWKDFFNTIEMDFSIKGDVDGDETVDVADVTAVVEVILNGEETEEVPTEQTFDAWTSTNTAHSSTSQNSYTMEATEGSVLTFDWEVSSESNYDWLIITLDGTQILKKSGNYSGSYTHTFTTAGTHTLVVKYTKDGSSSSGSDKGKIYNIKLIGNANNKNNPAADVDGDGSIDVADVTEVVNIILNPDTPTDSRAVDLGLSVKWASCNVGATAPEEYGGFYAWGETEEKSDYSWDTYKYCNGSSTSMTKYCTSSSYGTVDNKTTLEASDDVASVKWGGSWRMPTKAEQDELRNNCTWTITTLNGVTGYRVTGPSGNSIFLPAAGYGYGTGVIYRGSNGGFWSSSLGSSYSDSAYRLYFNSVNYKWNDYYRCNGLTVRPVCP